MNFFDINVHVSSFSHLNKVLNNNSASEMLNFEKNFTFKNIKHFQNNFNYEIKKKKFYNNYVYNLMVFTKNIELEKLKSFNNAKCVSKTILCDFRTKKKKNYISNLKTNKINAVKFHSYFQKITEKDYDNCVEISKICEEFKIPILIDTSFGGEHLYKIKNLELAVEILKKVKEIPVVLLHSGGLKVLEAFLVAEQFPNVFLDTSFSVNYFKNFSILKNYIEVYKKLGCNRVIYGSDFPYSDLRQSFNDTYNLLRKAFKTKTDIEKVFYKNAIKIFL